MLKKKKKKYVYTYEKKRKWAIIKCWPLETLQNKEKREAHLFVFREQTEVINKKKKKSVCNIYTHFVNQKRERKFTFIVSENKNKQSLLYNQ